MLYFSPSKNCTKNVSAHTLRLPTEALPRLLLGHITRAIRLTPFAQIWQSRTSYVRCYRTGGHIISIPPIFDMQSILNISCRHSEMAGYYFEVLETVEEPEAIYEGKMGECIRKQMFYTLQIRSERYMKSGAKGYERNIRYYQNINWR